MQQSVFRVNNIPAVCCSAAVGQVLVLLVNRFMVGSQIFFSFVIINSKYQDIISPFLEPEGIFRKN